MLAEILLEDDGAIPWVWLVIGFCGQAIFFSRFLVQWLASERAGRSVVPVVFWYFSLAGGATLFAYACFKEDPVFITGQVAGVFIYGRNLVLIRRHATDPVEGSGKDEGA